MTKTKRYEILHVEKYNKGYLKGYMSGMIRFDGDREHEFLFRFEDDPENGKKNTIVSIDYGYQVRDIENLWDDITEDLIRLSEKI